MTLHKIMYHPSDKYNTQNFLSIWLVQNC